MGNIPKFLDVFLSHSLSLAVILKESISVKAFLKISFFEGNSSGVNIESEESIENVCR